MVLKFTFSYLFQYPWEQVTLVHLTKYPTDKEPNIKGIEVLQKHEGSESAGEPSYLKYLVTCYNILPNLLRKVEALNVPYVYYEEECWVYKDRKVMKVKSRNITLLQYAEMSESSTYRVAAGNPNWTEFTQEGQIRISGLGPANWLIERFVKTFFDRGMKKNVKLVETIIEERYGKK